MIPRHALAAVAVLILGSALVPSTLGAQTVVLTGAVVDSANGEALDNVFVTMNGVIGRARTDAMGAFRTAPVPPGERVIFFRRPGYDLVAIRVVLAPDSAGRDVALGVVVMSSILQDPVTLAPVEVTAAAAESTIMPNFEQLKRTGSGTFITAEDIDAIDPRNTSDILRRLAGLSSSGDFIEIGAGRLRGHRGSATLYGNSAGNCTMRFYIDGIRASAQSVDVILPQMIAGIEVYRGQATIPIKYSSPGHDPCGLIVVWTKDAASRIN